MIKIIQYGTIILKSDIDILDTIQNLPKIGNKVNGFNFGNQLKGKFRINEDKIGFLYLVDYKVSPYIFIKLRNQKEIYINYDKSQATRLLFDKLKK